MLPLCRDMPGGNWRQMEEYVNLRRAEKDAAMYFGIFSFVLVIVCFRRALFG